MENIPSKYQILKSISSLQAKELSLMQQAYRLKQAGNLPSAGKVYLELFAVLDQHLQLALLNNQQYPADPVEIDPVLNPLIDHMMIYADLVEIQGDFKSAQEMREKANGLAAHYAVQTARGDRSIDVMRQQAVALTARGEFNAGISMYLDARDYYKEKNEPVGIAEVTAEMADALEWLGDYERALREVEYATRLIEPLLPSKTISQENILFAVLGGQYEQASENAILLKIYLQLLQTQARIQRIMGNYAEAEVIFNEVYPSIPSSAKEAIDFQFAVIQIGQKRYQQGLEILNRIAPVFNGGLYRPKRGALQAYQAEAYLGLNQPEQALQYTSQAVPDLAAYHDLDSLWRAQFRHGRALHALGRKPEALRAYLNSVDTINLLRKTPLGYRLDSTYLLDKMPVFKNIIDLTATDGQAENCCRVIEMIKSRTLTAALAVSREVRPDSSIQDQQFNQLSLQIDSLEYQGYMQGWTEELENQVNNLLAQRAEMLEKFRIRDPRWRSVSEPVPFDLHKVLSLLQERGGAAINLFYQPDKIVAILLKDGKASARVEATGPEIEKILEQYHQNLLATTAQPELFDPYTLGLTADKIVPKALLQKAIQASSLLIVPHGPLHLLPWAGLDLDGKRLFEYCSVGVLPNLSCLLTLQNKFSPQPRVALIGGPDYSGLPYLTQLYLAEEELQTVQSIHASFGGTIGQMALGADATEHAFWSLVQDDDSVGGILHVCCHGNFVSGDPLNAGLLMSDAKVDAAEIARSRIRYDEVILSACSTGYRPSSVGEIALSGDDILGLPGAFLEAGARSILVSIPPARDDVALQFMTIYHEQRAAGKTPLPALCATQQTLLADRYFAPALWIGFTVYGLQ